MKFTLHFLLHFKPIQQILSMKHLQQAVLSLGMKKERKKKKNKYIARNSLLFVKQPIIQSN